ncbi:hypothetical protein MKZ38_002989 [Zalerion maritima]|uniref:VOC domain-containing protein n=1 Tax=Zalerion maritima TaxID=339359 RepID=A0AAD5RNW6_9PEZI|nr:hypothetical protein MKZ38_002989 [Zalerion maritima]
MPIDHTGLIVPADKHKDAVAFYLAALQPLGYKKIIEDGPGGMAVGLGADKKPDWWILAQQEGQTIGTSVHTAFAVPNRAMVDSFHSAAVAAGGKCNGPPGPRPQYHPNYYGAFILDPVGTNVEAVCHAPE